MQKIFQILMTVVTLGTSALAEQAMANSPNIGPQTMDIAICRSVNNRPDTALLLKIRYFRGHIGIAGPMGNQMTAQIAEQAFTGPHVIAQFQVERKQVMAIQPTILFAGPGMELQIMTDPNTAMRGAFPSHLTAEANGHRVSENMTCRVVL